jgi:hypothetical protein
VDHYNAEVQAIPGYHLFVVEPPKRRFSLRLANVDPMFFGQVSHCKNRPILGCENCNFRSTGCSYCMSCNRATYKLAATKNLEMKVRAHSKCRGKGCRICFNRARIARRHLLLRAGMDNTQREEYMHWMHGTHEVDIHNARWPEISIV